ncbi:Cupin domain protein [Stieleria neptunia]|uniref:Cupin domain protein n=1 Tax=Stieleria neptunia TaxID=2527979 RepID=A0A518I275_9BACT|nr:cupin domain-containing protein [Stieleria neptunia]QDV47127.1 Cupin domain protein [Stieleria neptunia]
MDHEPDAVSLFAAQTRPLCDLSDSSFPAVLYGWKDEGLTLQSDATHYGFVQRGRAVLKLGGHDFQLTPGMYFSAAGECRLEGSGSGFVASRIGYRGLFQLGGPIEATGRLRYIDGCSDTLLISPAVKGDPCLNLLHIPPHTRQTAHTHPTVRFGIIVGGQGVCRSPNQDLALQPGDIFSIRPEGIHSFNTTHDSLLVIAWHPDSDCGPTHGDHPMINRTVIDGVSAAQRQRNQDASCTPAESRS